MKSIGIIAEYNPFTNGHLYHINKIKEKYPDHAIVLILSGNFTERGETSIINKFKKSQIALSQGVDLVVELPFPFATQSADYFAYGATTLLNHLKVDKLIFGSESDNIKDLETIVDTQLNNEDFNLLVRYYSKQGNNYPTALSKALYDLTGLVIDTPNDLLGISYIKSIKENNYNIEVETIKRTNDYHGELNIGSASSVRENLRNNKEVNNLVPEETISKLNNLHFIEDYYTLLKYKILSTEDLSIYQTVTEGIDNLIKEKVKISNTYSELIDNLKSKRYTHNKIQRMLLHILVGFTKEMANSMNSITYIRLLGFTPTGRKYLNSIKKDIELPIISKINREKDKMLEFEIKTTEVYDLINSEDLVKEEYKNHLNIGGNND